MEEFMISRRQGLKALGATLGAAALGVGLVGTANAAPALRPNRGRALTTAGRAAYINGLDLGAPSRSLARFLESDPIIDPTGQAAAIIQNNVVGYTTNVSDQHRTDALNSQLLAQLNSNALFDRHDPTQLMSWYRNYADVLSNIGWAIDDYNFVRYKASGSSLVVSKALVDLLGKLLTDDPEQVEVIQSALDALGSSDSNDPWYTLWSENTSGGTNAHFQVTPVTDLKGEANTLTMQVSGFSLQTSTTTDRVLWFKYSTSDTDLMYSSQSCTLDEDIFEGVRGTIRKKLIGNTKGVVEGMKLKK